MERVLECTIHRINDKIVSYSQILIAISTQVECKQAVPKTPASGCNLVSTTANEPPKPLLSERVSTSTLQKGIISPTEDDHSANDALSWTHQEKLNDVMPPEQAVERQAIFDEKTDKFCL